MDFNHSIYGHLATDSVLLAGNYARSLLRYFKGDTVEEWPLLPVTNGGHQLRDARIKPAPSAPAKKTAMENVNWVKLYPNPSKDALYVAYNLSDLTEQPDLLVTDLTGRVIYKGTLPVSEGQYLIDVSNWSAGTYAYNIKSSGKGVISGGVFMVAH